MADTQTTDSTVDVDSGAEVLGMTPAVGADDSGAFFEALDKEVNSMVYEEPSQTTSEELVDNNMSESPVDGRAAEVETSHNPDAGNVQQRYAASSREAKRLSGRLNELEPYVPILDAMKEDPNLITHVRNYFEGGGNAPKSMKEELSLDEDFLFDGGEAFDNPDSDSAKVLNATIDGLVQRRLSDYASRQKSDNIRLSRESEFRSKYEMNDDQWGDLKEFAQNKKLDLEDIYYLKNRDTREQNIQRNAQREVADQMQNVRQRPQSLSSSGSSEPVQVSPDDEVFDQLLGGESINRLLG
jgi:hypothetical protein